MDRLTLIDLKRRPHGSYTSLLHAFVAAQELLRDGHPRVALVDDTGAIHHVWTKPREKTWNNSTLAKCTTDTP